MRVSVSFLVASLLASGAVVVAEPVGQVEPSNLPLLFIPNHGQTDASIRYMVQSPEVRAGFSAGSMLLQLHGQQLALRFRGADRAVLPEGTGQLEAHANFLIGNVQEQWQTDLPTYDGVRYRNLYPGIDAVYGANTSGGLGRGLKSEFVVAPGADFKRIEMEYPDAEEVRIDPNGALVVILAGTELREDAPVIFQTIRGRRNEVGGRYRLIDAHTVGFEVDPYDATLPLVIDPIITYSTYLGGSGMGAVTALARDGAGNLYAGGWTEALDFPIAGSPQPSNRGGVDGFLVKINPTGNALLYATYIGGNSDDRVAGVAVDSSGQLIAVGATGSANFPLILEARASMVGGKEAFVVKLNAAGSIVLYSTFLGGSNYDAATAIAVDAAGDAYIGGDTLSADFIKLGATQAVLGGKTDAFLARLSTAGALVFSTFLGGSEDDHLGGVAVDSSGNAYVAGGTFSTNFPMFIPLQGTNAGGQDAFVSKIKTSSPAKLLYSSYHGGSTGSASAPEQANAIAADSAGNMYVTGVTSSANFPVTAGALQTTASGSRDAFVTKFAAGGTARLYSTYLGWSGFDWANAIAVDSAQNAYVAGYTSSVSFVNVGGVQNSFNGIYDAFVAKFDPQGTTLAFSTLYGGTRADQANAIAVDGGGNVFIGGQTASLDFPLAGAIQGSNLGGSVGWLARLGAPVVPQQFPSADSASILVGINHAITLTARYSHPAGATALITVAAILGSSASLDFTCYVTYDPVANRFQLANNVASSGFTTVVPGGAENAQNDQCTLQGAGTSASLSGTSLTLTIALILSPGYPPPNVYLYAADANSNTGWVVRNGFPQPSVDTVSPAGGMGASQIFTFVFSDTQNAANVTGMAMLINTGLTFTNGCYIVYDRGAGKISLLYDSAAGATPKPLGSIATVQNSQCALGAATLVVSGTSNILTVPLAFKGPFTGPKNVYMYAAGPTANTGWVQKGTYIVMAGGVPVANSVSPDNGSGNTRLFSFTMSDQGGSQFITGGAVLFAPTLNVSNACYLIYDRAANRVSLSYDNLSGSSPVTLGSSTSVANTRCRVTGTNSTVTTTATTLTLTLNLTFLPAFAGNKNSYLYASETGYESGWRSVGTWTVPGTPPTVVSLSPSSGSGATPTFTVTVSEAAAVANIQLVDLVATAGTLSNACYVSYNQTTGRVGLYLDDGATLITKPLGSSASLQNTQCAVGYTVVNYNGNRLAFSANLVFKPAFRGNKVMFVRAAGTGGSTSFTVFGNWTVR